MKTLEEFAEEILGIHLTKDHVNMLKAAMKSKTVYSLHRRAGRTIVYVVVDSYKQYLKRVFDENNITT